MLTPYLHGPVVRDLQQLAALNDVDVDLCARCAAALEHLHRECPAGLEGSR